MRNPLTANRHSGRGAGFVVLVIGLMSCSSNAAGRAATPERPSDSAAVRTVQSAAGAATSPVTSRSTTSPPGGSSVAAAAQGTPAASAAVDPLAVLQAGLAALTTTYHFVSTVAVDGVAVLVADGDRVGDGSRLTLTRDNAIVSYVITPAGSWTMAEGGTWQKLDTDPANADPISALRTPKSVQIASGDAKTTNLSVVVPQSSLGVPGDGIVTLIVTLADGTLRTISYATTVTDKPATVSATFGPAHDASAVVAPN